MRTVSWGICTVFALACGDGDQITIDPNFLDPGAQPGANATAQPGKAEDGAKPEAEGPTSEEDGAMTAAPELPACGDASASGEACSSQPPAANAAATDASLPPGSSSNSGSGSNGAAGAGSDSDDSAAAGGAAGAGGSSEGPSGTAGSDGSPGGDGPGGGGGSGAGGSNEVEPLPDLILDGAYLMATIQQDTVNASADQCLFNEGCVTGDGLRRVVRFGTRSANVGATDVIVGEPVAGNPLWEFDACHEHFHFEGYARYDLVEAGSGEVLPIGNKNGFCLRDLDSWSNPSCATYDCDYQGISAGCADVYTPDLDCQWVDITDVAPGTYELVVTVNTERSIREQSFDNNSATVTIEILPETVRVVP